MNSTNRDIARPSPGAAAFRGSLAARVAAIASAAAATGTFTACEGGYGGVVWTGGAGGSGGSGGAASSSSSAGASSSGDAGIPSTASSTSGSGKGAAASSSSGLTGDVACFPWTQGACPAAESSATLNAFMAVSCLSPEMAVEPVQILSGPEAEPGKCCYGVVLGLCAVAGRPLIVSGVALAAELFDGGEVASTVDDVTPALRAELAAAWARDGLAEHASIASFARLSASLLTLGAPADIVADAHRAALDEIRHAELCFDLASSYAGRVLTPGPLPLRGHLPVDITLEALARSSLVEGCLGEAVAAVVAAEALDRATDPAVRAALEIIARDEARHAELAFRVVAWAVREGGTSVRREVARAVREVAATDSPTRATDRRASATLEDHGRLDPRTEAGVRARVLRDLVMPALQLLSVTPASAHETAACHA